MYSKLFLLLSLIAFSTSSFADCSRSLKKLLDLPPRVALSEYSAMASLISKRMWLPKFVNPAVEMAMAAKWNKRSPSLPLIDSLLPKGMKIIPGELLGANENGVVKTNSGVMLHVSAEIKLSNGKKTSANIGFHQRALYDNISRENKQIVRADTKGVIVFIHGGGTKTTGHHVGVSLMNYLSKYGYDLVSIDMPWHAMGPRLDFESAKKSIETIRSFAQQYLVMSDKPLFLAGHSMGGVISDLYMRSFPKDMLFRGVIPMSTVGDPAPGGSITEKASLQAVIDQFNHTNPEIPESERDLGDSLARQNKISPVCGLYCDFLMYGLDWSIPTTHQGHDYLPALYLMGQGDGLYQGFQDVFAKYIDTLPNAEFRLYTPRRSLKDRDGTQELVKIGHMIFDHKPLVEFDESVPPLTRQKILTGYVRDDELLSKMAIKDQSNYLSTSEFREMVRLNLVKFDQGFAKTDDRISDLWEMESYVLVRDFLDKITGHHSVEHKYMVDPMENVLASYINNLVFRQFANHYVFQYAKATDKTRELGPMLAKISQELKSLERKKSPTAEDLENIEKLKAEKQKIGDIQSGVGTVSLADRPRYLELDKLKKEIYNTNAPLIKERKELRDELEKLTQLLKKEKKEVLILAQKTSSPFLIKLADKKEMVFKRLQDLDLKIRGLNLGRLKEYYNPIDKTFKPGFFSDIPENMQKVYSQYAKTSSEYQKALASYEDAVIKYSAEASDYREKTNRQGEVQARLKEIEASITFSANQIFKIEDELAKISGSDYFELEKHTVRSVLDKPVPEIRDNLKEANSLLMRIWTDWMGVWSVRTAETEVSLY